MIDKFLLVEGLQKNLQCPDWAFSPTTSVVKMGIFDFKILNWQMMLSSLQSVITLGWVNGLSFLSRPRQS